MSWNAKYVFLIFLTTFISYLSAILLEKIHKPQKRKWVLSGTAVICLGTLFFFKYFNFVSESVTSCLNLFTLQLNPVTLNLLLPVGISFYTFQTLSYVIDVYRGDITAEHHFGQYAAFISFFPQLVAGPIERTSNLLPQIKTQHTFDYHQATYGLKLMAWGYFKKIIIADTLSQYVSKVFDAPQQFRGFSLVLATVFFSIQIYCDFSGYSDIAVGTSKLMGINLMTNFKSPYLSQSIKEFWSRWHISLSTWFRDYVYIPLGGNRTGKARHIFNLIATFFVSGLWHGANWTFVIWGSIHGIAQALESTLLPKKYPRSSGLPGLFRVIFVFCFCAFTWIFFVSNSVSDAFYVIANVWSGIASPISYISGGISSIGLGKVDLLFSAISIMGLITFDVFSLKKDVISAISSSKTAVRWTIYCVFTLWIILNLPVTDASEFIYFQF